MLSLCYYSYIIKCYHFVVNSILKNIYYVIM
nr:MAG TPA: hypothetical protein [Caudoviricetes sp.]